jgi:hypothetical protein
MTIKAFGLSGNFDLDAPIQYPVSRSRASNQRRRLFCYNVFKIGKF